MPYEAVISVQGAVACQHWLLMLQALSPQNALISFPEV